MIWFHVFLNEFDILFDYLGDRKVSIQGILFSIVLILKFYNSNTVSTFSVFNAGGD